MAITKYVARYTAHARGIGGRTGFVRMESDSMKFDLAIPGTLQWKTTSTNPEELFACGLVASFGAALEEAANTKSIMLQDALVQADVHLRQEGARKALSAELYFSVPGMSHAMAATLVEMAWGLCPYARAMRGNVPMMIHINNHILLHAA